MADSENESKPLSREPFSGGRDSDSPGEKQMESGLTGHSNRKFFCAAMVDAVGGKYETLPPIDLIMYEDLLEKAWGWKRLVPYDVFFERSHYIAYLCEYYKRNDLGYIASTAANQDPEEWPLDPASPARQTDTATDRGRGLVVVAEFCLKKEEKLAAEWKIRMKAHTDVILPTKTIILSSLIKKCANSVIASGGKYSDTSAAALLCMAKEADLTLELLTRGAKSSNYYIYQGSEIRMCALSIMNSKSCHLPETAAALMGVTNEAKTLCESLRNEGKLIGSSCEFEPELEVSREIRYKTFDVMMRILQKSFFPFAAGQKPAKKKSVSGIALAKPENTTRKEGRQHTSGSKVMKCPSGQCSSSVGHSNGFWQKGLEPSDMFNHSPLFCNGDPVGREETMPPLRSNKYQGFLENAWGWERLVPFNGSVECSAYIDYLQEYYNHNALDYVASPVAFQNPNDWPLDFSAQSQKFDATGCGLAAIAEFCLKMEEQLVSEWKLRVKAHPEAILPFNTIIESSLIYESVHSSICAEGSQFSAISAASLLCIIKEAELTCHLLRLGAKPTDCCIKQSSVIRMCALSLMNLAPKGRHSVAAAAAMVGVAKEAKMMCGSMCHDSISVVNDLGWMIRFRTLDVMISIVQESSFPDENVSISGTALGSNGNGWPLKGMDGPSIDIAAALGDTAREDTAAEKGVKGNKKRIKSAPREETQNEEEKLPGENEMELFV